MKFIYYTMHNRHVDICMADLFKADNVTVLDGTLKPINNIILKALRKIHLSRKINKIISLPMKRIWLNSRLPKFDDNEEYCFIIIDSAPIAIDFPYLKRLRKKSDGRIKYLLFLFNPVELFKGNTQYNLNYMDYDYILTYDFDDSKKYGFIHYNAPYSIVVKDQFEVENDLYLICWNKGRLPVLHRIFQDSLDNGAKCSFRITDVDVSEQKYKDMITYNQRIEYDEVIKETLKCNCIMDMLSPGHTGVSTRYFEAVCYNKKLLTNNKNIVNLPFYNSDYMRIYEKPEDIDWEWVKERVSVDYHYDGRFSPLKLLEKIEEINHKNRSNE